MSKLKTGLGLVAAAALAVAISGPVHAAPVKSPDQSQTVKAGASEVTDFSSQRRRARYYRRGPGPGAALAGAAAIGLIGSAIAASAANDYYYDRPYYGPGYYGRPTYYGGYGPGYYRGW
jgi:hypothetical protein